MCCGKSWLMLYSGEIGDMIMNWVPHAEFFALLMTLLGGFFLIDCKIEKQSSRTDRLYEMFIELLKEKK